MWTCPICKTTNETNKCRSCGFDKSKDYTNHRSLCTLSKSGSKIFKPAQPGEKYSHGEQRYRLCFWKKNGPDKNYDHIFPEQERKHRRRCLGRIGKTERQHYGLDRGKTGWFQGLVPCSEREYSLRIKTAACCLRDMKI